MVEVDELVEGLVEEILDRVSDSEVHVVDILILGAELISREVGLWNVSWCSEFVQLLVSDQLIIVLVVIIAPSVFLIE